MLETVIHMVETVHQTGSLLKSISGVEQSSSVEVCLLFGRLEGICAMG